MNLTIQSKLLLQLAQLSPFKGAIGQFTHEDFQGQFEGMGLSEQIKYVMFAVNYLQSWDDIFASIIDEGTESSVSEEYMQATFGRGSFDTIANPALPQFQNIVIESSDYQSAVNISAKVIRFANNELITKEVNKIISAVIPAYQLLLRTLACRAMMYLETPAKDSPNKPGFWRDLTSNTNVTPLKPYNNGMLKFANTDTHYLFETLTEDTVENVVQKVREKGYGNVITVAASDRTWRAWQKLFDGTELEARSLAMGLSTPGVNAQYKFPDLEAGKDRDYISLPSSSFPDGYFLAFDPTIQGLYKRVPVDEAQRGLVTTYMTDETLSLSKSIQYKVLNTGYGVINRGFGAVSYVGAWNASSKVFTAPSAYVNFDFNAISKGWEAL